MRRPRTPAAARVALFVGGALALNYPLLSLFDRDASVLGVPLSFAYPFAVWAALIAGLAAVAEGRGADD